jgi:hypothetical protein
MDPASTILYSFGENVYEQIVYVEVLPGNTSCSYTFVNGNTEAGYEIVPAECAFDLYRYIEILKDTLVETVCFSECVSCDASGTFEISGASLAHIYPNPCQGNATLVFNDSNASHDVTIIDILGKPVKRYYECKTQSLIISRENLKTGIYFVKIESGNTWLSTLRLVISN